MQELEQSGKTQHETNRHKLLYIDIPYKAPDYIATHPLTTLSIQYLY